MSVTIAPKWAAKTTKVTLKQTNETTVVASWSAVSPANCYLAAIYQGDESEPYEFGAVSSDPKGKTWTATFSNLSEGTYTVKVLPHYKDENGKYISSDVFSTAKITLAKLWTRKPVVKIVSPTTDNYFPTGIVVSGTVTYYGKPDHLDVSITGNGLTIDPIDLTKDEKFGDAGTTGRTLSFEFFVAREVDGSYVYAPGPYTVTATAYNNAKTTKASSSAKATVGEAFLGDKITVKSIVQTSECSGRIIIKALS